MSYVTVVNRQPDSRQVNWVSGSSSTYSAPEPPVGVSRSKMPPVVRRSKGPLSGGSWSKIKESGRIRMTPYHVTNETIDYPLASVDRNGYFYFAGSASHCSLNDEHEDVIDAAQHEIIDLHSSWSEVGDLSYWLSKYDELPFFKVQIDAHDSDLQRAKTRCWTDLLHTYNFAEDLAELSDTVHLMVSLLTAAHHPLRAYREVKETLLGLVRKGTLTRHQASERIAGEWLQVQYGIMPIMYSVQDVVKVLQGMEDKYATTRATVDGSISNPDLSAATGSYFHEVASGSLQSRVTARGHWTSGSLHTFDRIGFNPFTTAWELVPFSFVIDWFLNVGDLVTAYAETWSSTADQLIGCVSKREKYHVETYLHLEVDERQEFSRNYHSTLCDDRTPDDVVYNVTRGSKRTYDLLLASKDVNNYDRTLFDNQDLHLSWSPFLDWKRTITGLALSITNSKRGLRALKKFERFRHGYTE